MTLTLTDRVYFYEQLLIYNMFSLDLWIKRYDINNFAKHKKKNRKRGVAFGDSGDRTWVSWAGKQGASHWAGSVLVIEYQLYRYK